MNEEIIEKILENVDECFDEIFEDMILTGNLHSVVIWHESVSRKNVFFRKNENDSYDVYKNEKLKIGNIKNPDILEKIIHCVLENDMCKAKILARYDSILQGKKQSLSHLIQIHINMKTPNDIIQAKIDKEKTEIARILHLVDSL